MMRLRPIVRSALCCLLCLTVCVIPAFANDVDAVIYGSADSYCYIAKYNEPAIPVFNPLTNLSATINYSSSGITEIAPGYTSFMFSGEPFSLPDSSGPYDAIYPKDRYIELIFPTQNGDLVIDGSNLQTTYNSLSPPNVMPCNTPADPLPTVKCDLLVDDVIVYSESAAFGSLTFSNYHYSGTVTNHFSLRFQFVPSGDYVSMRLRNPSSSQFVIFLPYDIFTFNSAPIEVDKIDVVIGKLDSISGSVQEIQSQVVEINSNVTEIKEGLQDSNSSIWGAFKDSLSGLFVPSADDLTGVKDGFDQLAQEKLGGAYQTVDMVSGGVQSVADKFKNPGSSPGVEFPGISVPLGGDVGTVTLAASQTVTIPEQMTEVLYPVAGLIIPIVCTIWTVRLGLDMVNCFMSGMSYGDFLHRHTDEEDNEV